MLGLRKKLYPNFVAWEYQRGKSGDYVTKRRKPQVKLPWFYKLRLRLCFALWPNLKQFRKTFVNEVKTGHTQQGRRHD